MPRRTTTDPPRDVNGRLRDAEATLSPAERRVAVAVLTEPAAVAFGTVAELAERAGVGVATVMRLAVKLGFPGFAALQSTVQAELADSLRPAADRIREHPAEDVLGGTINAELANVRATLEGVDRPTFRAAVGLLSRSPSRVFVASGDSSAGVAGQFAGHLAMLRTGVVLVHGSPVNVALQLADGKKGDVLVAIDFHRYDRWLVEMTNQARRAGLRLIALTDSPLSPLAREATAAFAISGSSAGPFDSHVGTLAMANALLAGVAAQRKATASDRLAAIETAWRDAAVLTET